MTTTSIKNYNQELDLLFDEWEKVSKECGLTGFCRDGLLNKGKIFSKVNDDDGKTYWGRERGNENEIWSNAERKILFLLKDTNGNPNEDMRYWIGRQNPTIISNRFFKNIALWFYGITSIQRDGTYTPFELASVPIAFSKTFDDLPIAIVNCKKESGGATVSDDTLLDYVGLTNEKNKKFGNYLRRQIEILNPNIIVCGGGVTRRVVLEIVQKVIFPHLPPFEKFNNWVYFHNDTNILLIDSYHPTNRYSYKDVYEQMMQSLQQYLKKQTTQHNGQ